MVNFAPIWTKWNCVPPVYVEDLNGHSVWPRISDLDVIARNTRLYYRDIWTCVQNQISRYAFYRQKLMEYRTPMQYSLGAYRQLFRGQWGGRSCLHSRLVVSRNSGLPFIFPPSSVRGLFSRETWETWGFARVPFSRRVRVFGFPFEPCRTLSSEVPLYLRIRNILAHF